MEFIKIDVVNRVIKVEYYREIIESRYIGRSILALVARIIIRYATRIFGYKQSVIIFELIFQQTASYLFAINIFRNNYIYYLSRNNLANATKEKLSGLNL